MNILIVILGSNVLNLLNDRINLGINFASDERSLKNIDWFLSGGIKNPEERGSTASEAYKMSEMISKSDAFTYGISKEKWNYILESQTVNQLIILS